MDESRVDRRTALKLSFLSSCAVILEPAFPELNNSDEDEESDSSYSSCSHAFGGYCANCYDKHIQWWLSQPACPHNPDMVHWCGSHVPRFPLPPPPLPRAKL